MRAVDIIGLFGLMLAGLCGLAFPRAASRLLAATVGASRKSAVERRFLETTALIILTAFASFASVGAALTVLKVIVPREGEYPGGMASSVAAAGVILCAVALLVCRVGPALVDATRSDSRTGDATR